MKNPNIYIYIVRQLSNCINKKYNGFHVISIEYSKKLRKRFKPIDIIYKPVKSPEKQIQCYYPQDISKSYRNSCGNGEKLSHRFAFECYYCGKFFARADKQKRHIENCSGVLGVIYNFNINEDNFEDNFKLKEDIPMTVYFDFETTAPTNNCFDPEQQKNVFHVLHFNCCFSSTSEP